MSRRQKWIIRLSMFFYMGLVYLTVPRFYFMALNVFLAYVPLEISFHLENLIKKNTFFFWLATVVWLFFYPNIPYLFTDLLHISMMDPYTPVNGVLKHDPRLWYNFFVLISGVLPFGLLSSWNLDWVIKHILKKITHPFQNELVYGILAGLVIGLSSVAIYIGRFLRFHSIEVFVNFPKLFSAVLNMWDREAVILIGFFAIFQCGLVCFYHFSQSLYKSVNS